MAGMVSKWLATGVKPKTYKGKSTRKGQGGSFAMAEEAAKMHGAKDPAAVAAQMGMAKYGKEEMMRMAQAGRKRAMKRHKDMGM